MLFKMEHHLFTTTLNLIILFALSSAETYYVTPAVHIPCPEEALPCFTLSEYATKPNNYFASNSTIILLPGDHSLGSKLMIKSIRYLGIQESSHSDTSITCSQSGTFTVEDIDVVYVRGLVLLGCMNNDITLVKQFTLEDCRIDGQGRNGTALTMDKIASAEIVKSSFSSYTGAEAGLLPFLGDAKVGGAVIAFSSKVLISHCEIFNNSVTYSKNAAGGAVYAFMSILILDNSIFRNNIVTGVTGRGGAVYVLLRKYTTINNSTFVDNAIITGITDSASGSGGAVYVHEAFPRDTLTLIYSATFINNSVTDDGGAVYVYAEFGKLILSNSLFTNNTAISNRGKGGALYACGSFVVNTCTFINNTVLFGGIGGGAIYSNFEGDLTIVRSTFANNRVGTELNGVPSISDSTSCYNNATHGGAVYVNSSIIEINGSTFSSNIATGGGNGGAVYAHSSIIHISDNTFNSNTVAGGGNGGALYAYSCNITIIDSVFENSTVNACSSHDIGLGGALYASWSPRILITSSKFVNNTVTTCNTGFSGEGGAVYVYSSTVDVYSSTFVSNAATDNGGAVYIAGDTIYRNGTGSTLASLNNCDFKNNAVTTNGTICASGNGGALYADTGTTVKVNGSIFISNTVPGDHGGGGAVYARSWKIVFTNSSFFRNEAVFGDGGAMYLFGRKTLYFTDFEYRSSETFATLMSCTFINNTAATGRGGALFLRSTNVNGCGFLDIHGNKGGTGVVYAVQSTVTFSGITTMFNNNGSLFVFSCNVKFVGHTNITNNSPLDDMSQEGGALTSIQSEIAFTGTTNLISNKALSGGAILGSESRLNLNGRVSISNNSASLSGGGIYAYQSELNLNGNVTINKNIANEKGGGIHAIGTTTKLTDGPRIYFVGNHAKFGGGVCLELNSKLYVVKTRPECLRALECNKQIDTWCKVEFSENSADHGGALFVNDTTNSGTCYATAFRGITTTSTECFFQNLGLHQYQESDLNVQNTYFINNLARVAGDILYGGMLDRCTVSAFTEYFGLYSNSTRRALSATSYIASISNITNQDFSTAKTVSSKAVRVCFCRDRQQDCSYHPPSKYVRKGETFTISLVAVDQVDNTISNNIIHASVSLRAKLGEGQSIQQTNSNGSCTKLTYTILSEQNYEQLNLYADGPCMDIGISAASLFINIAPCPIGFKDTNQRCDCDPFLKDEYVSNCSIDSKSVRRKDNTWFMYVNTTDHNSYIVHKHCPFDYCRPPTAKVFVNLNTVNGSTTLCAFNRSGKLCGSCKDGYSLSFGSSSCKPCSNNWLALIIVFATAGVVLVAFVLKCKLTVDTGTINSLIFYANIFASNRTTFFPSDSSSIFTILFTIFIAWLNLDFGFETRFYSGLDSYTKTWLQFAFPLYVIVIVVVIITVSDYSSKFAGLFTGKNPIATLATLILLSYTKLLRTIITSLSFTQLEYSDGSHELVWLTDGNVPYLKGKHIPLFIAALVFFTLGLAYTLLLFSWQWIVNPKIRVLTWITKNTKVIAFMDAYHNPFDKDHRYWIGLLLLARAILYLVSAVNVLGDPRTNLLSISLTIAFLIFFQLAVVYVYGDKVHKERLTYAFESISFLNLMGLTSVTFYITEGKTSQTMISYISISIAFIAFLVILVLHAYMYVLKKPLKQMYTKLRERRSVLRGSTAPSDLHCETATHDVLEEESVPVTEVDASPEALDTDETVEQIVTDEGQEVTATSEVCSGIDNEDSPLWTHSDKSGCSPAWVPHTMLMRIPMTLKLSYIL